MSAGFVGEGSGRRIGLVLAACLAAALVRTSVVRAYGIRAKLIVAGIVAVAAVGTSCHADPPRSSQPRTPRPAATAAGPHIGSTRLGARPLWTAPRPGQSFRDIRGVRVVGDTLAYIGVAAKPTSTAERIVIADVATGHVRRALDQGADLGHGLRAAWPPHPSFLLPTVLVGHEAIVLIPYARGTQRGIAGVSGTDGRVRWTIPSGPSDSIETDDRTLAVAVSSEHEDALRVYDLATHRLLWRKAGVTAPSVLGTTILGWAYDSPGTGVAGYDRDTGRRLWSRRYGDTRFAGTSRTMLAIGHAGRLLVLDARSGRELARAARPPDHGCADTSDPIGDPANGARADDTDADGAGVDGAGADFLACPDPGDPTSQSVRFVQRGSAGVEVSSRRAEPGFAAYDNRAWGDVLVGRDGHAFDPTGTPVPVRLPSGGTSIAAADGRYVVLFGGGRADGLITLQVHVRQG